ncbi:hypothetical protein FisN_14Hh125 [Fistulifera solaris]|uniref:F-type H+-transporting ATPase subunit epsilon n=1 Tax=Fistulifera solaris TaxID=1519565 RepID=A0A1Z5K8B7_FISSO|nr:hypothetical protein FisN_14Hh125 [Fistulifera solaris]|eukprot:GAX22503.1 hypothetical protein FisN_14Hh125 [Fistulifera solaris]
MSSTPVTTFWRVAGMSYLQYINKAAGTMRSVLKEPAKTRAMAQEAYGYNAAVWEAGKQGPKLPVANIQQAGK